MRLHTLSKIILFISAVTGILGCVGLPQVHVFSRHLSEQQISDIRDVFSQQPVELHINQLPIPFSMSQSSIIYSPLIESHQSIENVLVALETLDWSIQSVSPLSSDNHWFTKNTIGVYLIPQGDLNSRPLTALDMANTFIADQCDTAALIHFNKDYSYSVELASTDTAQLKYPLTGQWQIRNYPIVELRPTGSQWYMYFEIDRSVERDQISQIDMTTLTPLDTYSLFPDCQFQFGTRF